MSSSFSSFTFSWRYDLITLSHCPTHLTQPCTFICLFTHAVFTRGMKARGGGKVHNSTAYLNLLNTRWSINSYGISKEGKIALGKEDNPGNFPGGSYICLDAEMKDTSKVREQCLNSFIYQISLESTASPSLQLLLCPGTNNSYVLYVYIFTTKFLLLPLFHFV